VTDLTLASPAATRRLGSSLARLLQAPALVTLTGDLGTGKTTLVRAALRALGVSEVVASPSFTIAQSYIGHDGVRLHHLDLYRLQPGPDVELFPWEDYLDDAITFVEWPEAGAAELPPADITIDLEHQSLMERRATVAASAVYAPMLEKALADPALALDDPTLVDAEDAAMVDDRVDDAPGGESGAGEGGPR